MQTQTSGGKVGHGDDEILTLREAANQLKVSGSWLRRSDCPRVRFSMKMVRFNRAELLKWFNARSTRAA